MWMIGKAENVSFYIMFFKISIQIKAEQVLKCQFLHQCTQELGNMCFLFQWIFPFMDLSDFARL